VRDVTRSPFFSFSWIELSHDAHSTNASLISLQGICDSRIAGRRFGQSPEKTSTSLHVFRDENFVYLIDATPIAR